MPYTPCLEHLGFDKWDRIYEPAQDSFLLLDAIEGDSDHLKNIITDVVVEVGVGSGIISSFLDYVLKGIDKQNHQILGIDLNPEACLATLGTYKENNVKQSDVVHGDLLSCFGQRQFIDIALFNPPYVPSTTEEVYEGGITAAWAGGHKGRVVTDIFLSQVIPRLTSGTGTLYLLLIHQNEPSEVVDILNNSGCTASIIKERRYGEHAYIIKAVRD